MLRMLRFLPGSHHQNDPRPTDIADAALSTIIPNHVEAPDASHFAFSPYLFLRMLRMLRFLPMNQTRRRLQRLQMLRTLRSSTIEVDHMGPRDAALAAPSGEPKHREATDREATVAVDAALPTDGSKPCGADAADAAFLPRTEPCRTLRLLRCSKPCGGYGCWGCCIFNHDPNHADAANAADAAFYSMLLTT